MLLFITCQTATALLDQQPDRRLPWGPRAGLWVHLRWCPYCQRYAKQTVLIAELARAAATAHANSDRALSAAAKQRMRERLAAAR